VLRGEVKLVCISPETGKAVRELGFPVAAEATVYTADGLIAAVKKLAGERAAPHTHHESEVGDGDAD
jgi:uroporphyrinogen III methyltransferase/synthase